MRSPVPGMSITETFYGDYMISYQGKVSIIKKPELPTFMAAIGARMMIDLFGKKEPQDLSAHLYHNAEKAGIVWAKVGIKTKS